MRRSIRLLALSAALLAFAPLAAQEASVLPEEEEQEETDDTIIMTGSMRVRQGGAQDIRHFRSIAADVGMPRPESLTIEGLMGEHDLSLPATRPCSQLFCLVTEAMAADLPTRPHDRLFVGLGFASNIDAESWRREPLNLVAVVDKSGSMSGQPLNLVRRSLRQIVGQMRDGDQLSIVLYGTTSHLYLAPTPIGTDRERVLAAIDRIESEGSTAMEEGLKLGYRTAFASAPAFDGNTRLMLFTDEQPNVGRTDAESFMGLAETASSDGIGLTTIGVGVQFDGALATRVSSVRGGNLFFISDEATVRTVFENQLDTMVSELAHDVRITMSPREGYSISGVFGVPDGLMADAGDGVVTIDVPTAFLSTNGGGIFLSLAKSGERQHLPAAALEGHTPLLEVALSYVGARDGAQGSDRVTVAAPAGRPSAPLRLAHLLTDEYFALRGASVAFHRQGDARQAYHLLSGLSDRIEASRIEGLGDERELVGDMLEQAAYYAGYSGERPRSLRHLAVIGSWQVSQATGVEDIRRGDMLAFFDDEELVTTRRNPRRGEEPEDYERYQINERQIYLPESDLVLDYRARGDRLILEDERGLARITLTRVESPTSP